MANEIERSSYQKFDWNALTEEYKRSSHDDFATSSELKARSFSGWRHNSIAGIMELWVLGEVRRNITPEMYRLDPQVMEKVYAEVFAI